MLFIWPFLPFSIGSPYKGTTNKSSWAYLMVLGMTIVQNPHAHCGNYENPYVSKVKQRNSKELGHAP
jgi:hypothetical protein